MVSFLPIFEKLISLFLSLRGGRAPRRSNLKARIIRKIPQNEIASQIRRKLFNQNSASKRDCIIRGLVKMARISAQMLYLQSAT
jgi:hypothetical protein